MPNRVATPGPVVRAETGLQAKLDKSKSRIWTRKWQSLRARGITPPRNEAEAKARLKAAHGY